MLNIHDKTATDLYARALKLFTDSRHTEQKENVRYFIEPVSLTVDDPGHMWLVLPGRRLNLFYACAQVFWALTGRDSVHWIGQFNKDVYRYADGGKPFLSGAPGRRIFHYPRVGVSLEKPHSRDFLSDEDLFALATRTFLEKDDACISLYHHYFDNQRTNNPVELHSLYFRKLHDTLSLTAIYPALDFYQFPYWLILVHHLGLLMSGELGLPIGTQTHVINNLWMDSHELETHRTLAWGAWKNAQRIEPVERIEPEWTTRNEVERLWVRLDTQSDDVEASLKGPKPPKGYWSDLATVALMRFVAERVTPSHALEVMENLELHPTYRWLAADYWNLNEEER